MLKNIKESIRKFIDGMNQETIDDYEFKILCTFNTYLKLIIFTESLGKEVGIWKKLDTYETCKGQCFKIIIDSSMEEGYLKVSI